ncbi:MAG TPA: carbohydrate ABC transporter permease [Ktedonobacteraceae bacterium]|nr:carbohydrate ABC transporter permease [Ktedonobacteraceae bacterium]
MSLASAQRTASKAGVVEARARTRYLRRVPGFVVAYIILVLGVVVSLFPYFLALMTSLKPPDQIFSSSAWSLPHPFTLQNYIDVVTKYNFLPFVLHTLIYAAILTIGQLIFSTMAAYAFARMEFPGREQIFWLYLATLMVPQIVTLIPLFIILRTFGLINTWAGLVLPFVLGTPFGIFLMRQFFLTIPRDLEKAARIDGAGTLQILRDVILPLSRPIMATLAVITFVQAWNNFLWPLIITDTDNLRVLTVGIAAFQSNYGTQWNLMMAATFIALGPLLILFFLFQQQIVRSIHLSGFK